MAYHKHSDVPEFDLIIGDKTFSSWSMRAWLVAVQSGLPFKEICIKLDQKDTAAKIAKYSPSGKIPALRQGKRIIWDSLAIAEYLNELSPEAKLWPEDAGTRALARSYASEMHAGFPILRSQMSMDLSLRTEIHHLSHGAIHEINRILEMWKTALKVSEGPYLFGDFCIADAFFAPVVFRFISYGIKIKDPMIRAYMKNIENHHGVMFWVQDAKSEKPKAAVF
ncbi:glutathione S-transferase family protein [Bdellovibrio sp. NC01]|uniref:glutathione S-transferase family protein n=1 Tax=Bdellovibrio sp. NC01 TaxID=2220073 RepID=UPI001158B923|nr:glutathione S-transferase family protein [Bdellovibrio sp. NC01]QDK37041.1 glutathione S-transferase family protein [Bdellovibrio sp. NC01]